MELHQLRYFLAIARNASFTRAAEACHVSQPSLSAQVAKLEDELGGPLFERLRSGARLTARGQVFLPRATEALSQLEQGRGELEDLAGLRRGEVTLGCLPTTGAFLLPPLLREFRRRFPLLNVRLIEESSPDLAVALREGRVDLALLDEAGLGVGIDADLLFREDLWAAVPSGHALAGRGSINLAELADEPFVVMKSGQGFRKIVTAALAAVQVVPRIVYESGGIDTVQALVEAGLGVSLVPAMMKRSPGPVYLALLSPTPSRTLLLARKTGATLSAAATALADLAHQELPVRFGR